MPEVQSSRTPSLYSRSGLSKILTLSDLAPETLLPDLDCSIFTQIIAIPDEPGCETERSPKILSKEEIIHGVETINAELAAILRASSFLDYTCLYDHVGESLARAASDFIATERVESKFSALDAWKILLETCKSQPALLRHKSDVSISAKAICELCHPALSPRSDQERDLALLKAATWLHDIGKADTSDLLVRKNNLHKTTTLVDALKGLPTTFTEIERARGKHAPDMKMIKEILAQIAAAPDFFKQLEKVLDERDPKEIARWQPYIDVLKTVWQIRVFDANCPINRAEEYDDVITEHDGLGYGRLIYGDIPWEVANIMLDHHAYHCDNTKEADEEDTTKLLNSYLAIADVMNAILCRKNNSHPPRQDRGNVQYVLTELLKNNGTQFDPRPVAIILENERATMQTWKKFEFNFYPDSEKNYENHPGGIVGFAERLFDDLKNHTSLFMSVPEEQTERAKIAVIRMITQEFDRQTSAGKNSESFSFKCKIAQNGHRVITLGTTNMPPFEIILNNKDQEQNAVLDLGLELRPPDAFTRARLQDVYNMFDYRPYPFDEHGWIKVTTEDVTN